MAAKHDDAQPKVTTAHTCAADDCCTHIHKPIFEGLKATTIYLKISHCSFMLLSALAYEDLCYVQVPFNIKIGWHIKNHSDTV